MKITKVWQFVFSGETFLGLTRITSLDFYTKQLLKNLGLCLQLVYRANLKLGADNEFDMVSILFLA